MQTHKTIVDQDPTMQTVDLWCSECDEQFGNGGNNVSLREARAAARVHFKQTGHADFAGSQMIWVKVVTSDGA